MTVTRWWDPGVPVDLLTPGDDPVLDAANRLVALHRTGAAALLAAAGTPLCDAGTVDDALEMAAASTQVEIAKTDGELTGLVDAANTAAVFLYRSAVAKGVIPPHAAARAAKVYGVPAPMLGRYPQLAADPKTPDAVLTDTADRALFGWVANLTAVPVDVAKAVETPEERRVAQAQETRARTGRYARTDDRGVTETTIDGKPIAQWLADNLSAPEQVATPPKPEPSMPQTRRQVRQVRRVRQVSQAAAGRKAHGRVAGARKAAVREALTRTARTVLQEARVNASRVERPVPAPFGDYEPMPDATPIRAPGALVLPLDEFEAFRAGMARGRPGEVIFQMGALDTYVHYSPTARVTLAGTTTHDEQRRYVAEQIVDEPGREGLPDPKVWELTAEEEHELDAVIRAGNRMQRDRLIREFAVDRLRKVQKDLGLDDRDLSISKEVGYVDFYLDYDDMDTPLLVWRPPVQFGDYTTHRPRTNLAEVTVEDGWGETDPGTRHGAASNRYDPSMPLSIQEDPDPVMFFDQANKAVVYQVSAKATEDDVAAEARRRHQTTAAGGYTVARGRIPGMPGNVTKAEGRDTRRAAQAAEPRAHGRYTTTATNSADSADSAVTETTIDGLPIADWIARRLAPDQTEPAAAPAAPRQVRQVRQVRPAGPAAGRQAQGRVAEGRQAAQRFAAAREGTRPGPDEMALVDGAEYHLMPTRVFKDKTGISDDTAHAPLDGEARQWLNYETKTYTDEQIAVELFTRHMRAKKDREGELWHSAPVIDMTIDVSGTDEYGNNIGHEQAIEWLARELHRTFETNPNLGALEIDLRRVWANGRQQVKVQIRGNTRPLPDQTLVRRGDIDPDAPMLVTWEGRRRALNAGWIRNDLRAYWPLPEADLAQPYRVFWVANPWVEQWVAHSPDEYLRDS